MQGIKITPLGGLQEIGKNMTVIETEDTAIIVDCGLGFSDEDYLGINYEIPDFSYLYKIKKKIKGLLITHAHEDHIGGISYLLLEFPKIKIYGTEFSVNVIKKKLEDKKLNYDNFFIIKANKKITFNDIIVETIHTNHSIAGSVAFAINTKYGTIIHTGDFKIEKVPYMSKKIDLKNFEKYGNDGVLLLMSDSTNAQQEKIHIDEIKVGEEIEKLIKDTKKRVIISTFASNIFRILQIIKIAEKYNKKIALSGRSMETMLDVALSLGYANFNKDTLVKLDSIKNIKDENLVIITTGSQGEEMSALHRIAHNLHKQISVTNNDLIILSSSAIPGNEKPINNMIELLAKKGAEIIYNKNTSDIHTSGHACKNELAQMINICKPKYFMPIHGEYIHLSAHKQIAIENGVKEENILITEIGKPIIFENNTASFLKKEPAGKVIVNDIGAGYIGLNTLEERKKLAKKGALIVNIIFNKNKKLINDNIHIVNAGFMIDDIFNEKIDNIKFIIDYFYNNSIDSEKEKIKEHIRNGIYSFVLNEFGIIPNLYLNLYFV